jgi:hypothetical protein
MRKARRMTADDRLKLKSWVAVLLSNTKTRLTGPLELDNLIDANPHWLELSKKMSPNNPVLIDLVGKKLRRAS